MRLPEARKYLLRELREYERSEVVVAVTWSSANNESVCDLCQARNGERYTFQEAREIVNGPRFCKQSEPGLGCRCVWVPELEALEASADRVNNTGCLGVLLKLFM